MKKIVLTGGGTAGHVIPNLALVPSLKANGYEIFYIGSHNGIERKLVESEGITYYGISSGKLRRYLNFKNITDIFRVIKGLGDSIKIIRKIKPNIVFSKGGFVTVPVIVAAKMLGIKGVIHESDMTPGLANRLSLPFATRICCSFPETLKHIPDGKGVLTGTPIRGSLFEGDKQKGQSLAGFKDLNKPTLLITGGSQGAAVINACVRESLDGLLEKFNIIHLCGKGNLAEIDKDGYSQFEYLSDDMPHVLAAADIVLSRAGANTLFELIALKKPHLLIPLSKGASRGDQILNAASTKKQGFSMVLPEEEMDKIRLINDLDALYNNKEPYINAMKNQKTSDGIGRVIEEIERL